MFPVRCATSGASPGKHVIHALPATVRQTCTPPGDAVRGFWMPAILALVVLCGTLGFSDAGSRARGEIATAVVATVWATTDAHDGGDPPHQAPIREFHLKKPRINTLQVCTRPASPVCPPLARPVVDLRVAVADEAGTRQLLTTDEAHAHRPDPALRLHPGQAPPHAA